MNRIRELRKHKKISGKELGRILGYAESTILQWERGVRQPDMTSLTQLANFFNVSTDYLLNRSDYTKIINAIDEYDNEYFCTICLLDNYPTTINELKLAKKDLQVKVPVSLLNKQGELFAVICQDDKMIPTIEKGDTLIMGVDEVLTSHDIVLVNYNNESFLARYNKEHDVIILTFDKVGSKIILINNPHEITIIAKVLEIRRKL